MPVATVEGGGYGSLPQGTKRGRFSEANFGQPLFIGGLVLLGTFINTLLFSSFPFQPILPEWQLRISGTLLTSGITALIGVLLIHISPYTIRAKDTPLAKQVRLIRRLAGLAAIGYFALVPAQIYAGVRLLAQRADAEKQPGILWGRLRGRIQAAESETELRELLGRLPQPPTIPDKLDLPLPTFKQSLITGVEARFAELENQIEKSRSERLQGFIYESIRNTIQSLLLALGFAAVSKDQQSRAQKFGRRGGSFDSLGF